MSKQFLQDLNQVSLKPNYRFAVQLLNNKSVIYIVKIISKFLETGASTECRSRSRRTPKSR